MKKQDYSWTNHPGIQVAGYIAGAIGFFASLLIFACIHPLLEYFNLEMPSRYQIPVMIIVMFVFTFASLWLFSVLVMRIRKKLGLDSDNEIKNDDHHHIGVDQD